MSEGPASNATSKHSPRTHSIAASTIVQGQLQRGGYVSMEAQAHREQERARALFNQYHEPSVPVWRGGTWTHASSQASQGPSALSSPLSYRKSSPHTPSKGVRDAPGLDSPTRIAAWSLSASCGLSPEQTLGSPTRRKAAISAQKEALRRVLNDMEVAIDADKEKDTNGGLQADTLSSRDPLPANATHSLSRPSVIAAQRVVELAQRGFFGHVVQLMQASDLAVVACNALVRAQAQHRHCLDSCLPELAMTLPTVLGYPLEGPIPDWHMRTDQRVSIGDFPSTLRRGASGARHSADTSALAGTSPNSPQRRREPPDSRALIAYARARESVAARHAALGVLRSMVSTPRGRAAVCRTPKLLTLLGAYLEVPQCRPMELLFAADTVAQLAQDPITGLHVGTNTALVSQLCCAVTQSYQAVRETLSQESCSDTEWRLHMHTMRPLSGALASLIASQQSVAQTVLRLDSASQGSDHGKTSHFSPHALPSAPRDPQYDSLSVLKEGRVIQATVGLVATSSSLQDPQATASLMCALDVLAALACCGHSDVTSRVRSLVTEDGGGAAPALCVLLDCVQDCALPVRVRTQAQQLIWLCVQGPVRTPSQQDPASYPSTDGPRGPTDTERFIVALTQPPHDLLASCAKQLASARTQCSTLPTTQAQCLRAQRSELNQTSTEQRYEEGSTSQLSDSGKSRQVGSFGELPTAQRGSSQDQQAPGAAKGCTTEQQDQEDEHVVSGPQHGSAAWQQGEESSSQGDHGCMDDTGPDNDSMGGRTIATREGQGALKPQGATNTAPPTALGLQASESDALVSNVGSQAAEPGKAPGKEAEQLVSATLSVLSCLAAVKATGDSPVGSVTQSAWLSVIQSVTLLVSTAQQQAPAADPSADKDAPPATLQLQRQAWVLVSNLCLFPATARLCAAAGLMQRAEAVIDDLVIHAPHTTCSASARHRRPGTGVLEPQHDAVLGTLVAPAAVALANYWAHAWGAVDDEASHAAVFITAQRAESLAAAALVRLLPAAAAADEEPDSTWCGQQRDVRWARAPRHITIPRLACAEAVATLLMHAIRATKRATQSQQDSHSSHSSQVAAAAAETATAACSHGEPMQAAAQVLTQLAGDATAALLTPAPCEDTAHRQGVLSALQAALKCTWLLIATGSAAPAPLLKKLLPSLPTLLLLRQPQTGFRPQGNRVGDHKDGSDSVAADVLPVTVRTLALALIILSARDRVVVGMLVCDTASMEALVGVYRMAQGYSPGDAARQGLDAAQIQGLLTQLRPVDKQGYNLLRTVKLATSTPKASPAKAAPIKAPSSAAAEGAEQDAEQADGVL